MHLIQYQNGILCKPFAIPFRSYTGTVCADTLFRMTNKEIRRANANHLKDEVGGIPQFEKKLGRAYSYVRNILTGEKDIGDKTARLIEEKFDKPRGWLDIPRDEAGPSVTHAPQIAEPATVHETLSRLCADLGIQIIDHNAMKRAYRAVEVLFASRPEYGLDAKVIALTAAYKETLRDAKAAERVVRDYIKHLSSQRSKAKKGSGRGEQ